MSQMTEVSEKCNPQVLEENLNKIKACGEYIQRSYEEAKEKYDAIAEKDQNTDEYKKSFSDILGLLKNVCKETCKRIKDLEEKGLNSVFSHISVVAPDSSSDNVDKPVADSSEKKADRSSTENSGTVQLNGEKEIEGSSTGNSDGDGDKQVASTKERSKTEDSISDNVTAIEIVPQIDSEEKDNTNKAESVDKNQPAENMQEGRNLDKENEKPQENTIEIKEEDKQAPKGIIRLVSIEKLLDPQIVARRKPPERKNLIPNLFTTSVIVLDSDDDEPSEPVLPFKDSPVQKKTNETERPNEKERTQTETIDENVKRNEKVKKVSVRIASCKLLNRMIEEKRFRIKLRNLSGRVTSEPELSGDNDLESARKLRKRTNDGKRRIKLLSSDSEDDDSDNGRRLRNRAAKKKAKSKMQEVSDDSTDYGSDASEFVRNYKKRPKRKEEEDSSFSSEDESVASIKKKITGNQMTVERTSKDGSDDDDNTNRDLSGGEKSDDEANGGSERNGDEIAVVGTDSKSDKKSEKNESRKKKEHTSKKAIISSSSEEDGEKKDKSVEDKVSGKNVEDKASGHNKKSDEKEMSGKESDQNDSGGDSSDSAVLRKKRKKSQTPTEPSDNDTDSNNEVEKKKTKKRKRIRNADDSDDSSGNEKDGSNKKRKNIRKLIKTKDLLDNTRKATKEEEERKKRIQERQKLYNQIYEKPENVELKELVLDFDEESKEKLLSVDSGLLKKLKPHQAAGIKFMWDACFETLKDTREKPGSGCILAHCMGLGKTLQVVALTHTLLTNSAKTKIERVLVISPLSTLNNWAKEYIHWMKFCKNKNIEIYDMSKWREKNLRVHKIKEWFEEGGVCILGYDMYRILANPKSTTIKKKQRESLQTCLVDPGPDMVICDEGHLLKNEKTSLSQAVNRMKTLRRIVLTGTPLQNNLKEYYCMIQFIKPNLLGTYKEYLNRFVNPITNGQYTDSTARDIQLMKHRSHVLHKLLEGCIQRRDYSVLAPYLPPKHEYVIFITLTDMQKKLYEFYMTKQRDIITEAQYAGKGALLFQDFQNLRRIWTHPMCLRVNSDIIIKKKLDKLYDSDESEGSLKDFIVDDEEDTTSTASDSSINSSDSGNSKKAAKSSSVQNSTRRTRGNPDVVDEDNEAENAEESKDDPSEWWKPLCPEEELNNLNHSAKLILLLEILESCEAIGDKILLFSQSLQSLDVIEHFLSLIDKKTQGDEIEGDVAGYKGSWTPGLDYFRLDGSSTVENREAMCKAFNDVNNLRARLFLISTRAGSLGINLVAANRVIIFDVSWNPSHDTQSIFRIYRFGQEKPCYIYRFISLGTMEQKVYERQVTKQATAKRVVDEQQIGRHYNQSDLLELYKYELEQSVPREVPALPKDRLFADLLSKHEKLIYKYHEHDSLLENEESENLSEEERKAAWAEYQAEKERPTNQFIAYNRAAYGNTNGPVTSNKVFGIRTDILLKLLNVMVRQHFPAFSDTEVVRMVPIYLQRLSAQMNNNDTSMYRELLELHNQLEMPPQGYYMNPMAFPNQPMIGVNPLAYMNPQPGQFMAAAPPPQNNPSHVYEIE